jgi:beta-lactamase class A
MTDTLTRRTALLSGLALAACAPRPESLTIRAGEEIEQLGDPRFAAIDQRIGGRVGVAAWNTATNAWLVHRMQERFAMASTFKWVLGAQMLHMDMRAPGHLAREVRFSESDLLEYAPVAREHLARAAMTIEQAAEGAVVMSDNTCANLLLRETGGPQALTQFVRSQGDNVTRLDRLEPDLNEVPPGDERDTTSPESMVRLLQRVLLTDEVLTPASREKLAGWMVASPTGRQRLRAGLPTDWRVGDKTGTWNGPTNATNDVAIAWPPGRAPILIACYLSASMIEPAARNAVHAEIGRIIAEEWA